MSVCHLVVLILLRWCQLLFSLTFSVSHKVNGTDLIAAHLCSMSSAPSLSPLTTHMLCVMPHVAIMHPESREILSIHDSCS